MIDDAGRQIIAARNGLGALINTPGQILNELEAVNRLVDGIGVERRVRVAREHLRPAHTQLALFARPAFGAVERDDANLDAR